MKPFCKIWGVPTWGLILGPLIFLLMDHGAGARVESPKNILFYIGSGSYSMRISIWPLIEALTEQGHHVTFISGYKSKNPHPGVVDFVPEKLQEWTADISEHMNAYEVRRSGNLLPFWFTLIPQLGITACEKMYEDPAVVQWVQRSSFDLVFIDSVFNDCAFGLAHVFGAKTIVLSTTTMFPWFYDAYGVPDDTSWAGGDICFAFPARDMHFGQRLLNGVLPVVWKLIREWWYFPKLEEITKNALNLESVPSFAELERNVSLTFVTTHYSQEFARALPPNVVAIGGLVLSEKTPPLPREMEEFIARGKEGFIYVSFGTIAEFTSMGQEERDAFIAGLLRFPNMQFIWKSKQGVGVELPKNFLVLDWAPQQSLLAHPKIRAFITHAGLGGINEAIYHAVPMISCPYFAEQDYNANLVEAKGIGIKLELTTLKEEELVTAIREITESSRIPENMRRISNLFKDRPESPLQTALWWTNYVLNHEAADILEFVRPLGVTQPWWVRRQLDVWLFVGLVALVIVGVLLCLLKGVVGFIGRILFKGNSSPGKIKKEKQT